MKVEKKKTESFYILGDLLERIIKICQFEKKSFEIWRISVFFFIKNPLYMSKSYFSGQNFSPITAIKFLLKKPLRGYLYMGIMYIRKLHARGMTLRRHLDYRLLLSFFSFFNYLINYLIIYIFKF
jgi:hypothetical protein